MSMTTSMTTSMIQSMTMSLTLSPPEPLLQEGSVVVHDCVLVRTLWQEEPGMKDNCQEDRRFQQTTAQ